MEEKDLNNYQTFGSFESELLSRPNPKKKIITGFVVGFLLIVVGVVGVLAARIWDPLWNPFRPAPEIVLARAMENMIALNSYHTESAISANITNLDTQETVKFSLQVSGDTDKFDPKTPKSHSIITLNVGAQGMSFVFGGEAIKIGDVSYIKISTLPAPFLMGFYAEAPQLKPLIDKFQDSWISFDPNDLGMSMGVNALTPQERKEFEQKMQDLIFKYPPLKVKKELPDQKINGQKMYQIVTVVDKENLKKYILEVLKLVKEYNVMPSLEQEKDLFSPEEISKMNESIDKFFEQVGEIEVYFLVGQDDYLIHQIKGLKTIEKFETEKETQVENLSVQISWSFDFSDFNKKMDIKAPEKSQSIMELFMNLLMNYYGGSSQGSNFLPSSGLEYNYPLMEVPGL